MGWRFSWIAIFTAITFALFQTCHSKFYIYPWPSTLHDVYPLPNATLHQESTYSHEFYANDGVGKLLDGDLGLFQTWQFALYKNILQRLEVSQYRTFNPDEATAFIIPFDCGVHSYIDHTNGRKRLGSPQGWVAKMLLENSPYMQRHHGHDHFVIFSITLYQMIGVGVKMFYQNVCYNCTTLVIESSPAFVTPISGWPYKNYWYAVPYPSSFHWWEGIKTLPWSLSDANSISHGSDNNNNLAEIYFGRDIFVLFIGSIRTATVSANRFRKLLQDQCFAAGNHSTILGYGGNNNSNSSNTNNFQNSTEPGFSWCEWHTVSHSCHALINTHYPLTTAANGKSNSRNDNINGDSNSETNSNNENGKSHVGKKNSKKSQSLLLLYRRAVFCPAPVGDSLTRKSLFDGLLAGCIPVIFDRRTLSQYHWHIPPPLLEKIAVVLTKPMIISPNSFKDAYASTNSSYNSSSNSDYDVNYALIDILRRQYPANIIRDKQRLIAKYASHWQYALVPAHIRQQAKQMKNSDSNIDVYNINYNHTNPDNRVVWEPPHPDAVTVIIRHILDRSTVLPAYAVRNRSYHSDNDSDLFHDNENITTTTTTDFNRSHNDVPSIVSIDDANINAMNRTYLRSFCWDQNDLLQDGIFYSRGLAWHRLRQLCQSVDLLIQLEDGRVVDMLSPLFKESQQLVQQNYKRQKQRQKEKQQLEKQKKLRNLNNNSNKKTKGK